MSFIVIGISVAMIQGIDAEKNSNSDIQSTPIINLFIKGDPAFNIAGIYMSAKDTATPFAASMGSGILKIFVNG